MAQYRNASSSVSTLSPDYTESDSFEPPLTRVRSNNNSVARIDFCDRFNPTFNISTVDIKIGGNGTSFFTRNTKRWCVQTVLMSYITPNLNERNNRMRYYTRPGNVGPILGPFDCVFIEGFYPTLAAINTEITTGPVGMNSFSGVNGGITFSLVPQALDPFRGRIQILAGPINSTFLIDQSSIIVTRGLSLLNLPKEDVTDLTQFSQFKLFGPAYLKYTRYVDVVSSELTNYQKILNVNSGTGRSDTITRIFIPRNVATATAPTNEIIYQDAQLIWHNWKADVMLASIDFKLLDEYGDLFYIPARNPRALSNVDINLILGTEV